MRPFHLAFGGLLVVAFVLTGQYMDKALAPLDGMAEGPLLHVVARIVDTSPGLPDRTSSSREPD